MTTRQRFSIDHPNTRIFFLTFSILALELALIRWTGGQVRIFAYFGNLVLIVAFLGLGLGVGLGRNGKSLLDGAFPCIAIVALVLGFSDNLGIADLRFPDPSVSMWGSEILAESSRGTIANLLIFVAIIASIGIIFTLLGTELGAQFFRVKTRSVDAYLSDLAGSLVGSICFACLTLLSLPPPYWLAIGLLPLMLLRLRLSNLICVVVAIVAAYLSVGAAVYSPYNRIEIGEVVDNSRNIVVNRDFHQFIHDLSNASIAEHPKLVKPRIVYDLPFKITAEKNSVVVVGAGTGNDVQAALRNGFTDVTAVDIDPKILAIGRQFHFERPYHDERVTAVAEDARAFFKQYRGPKFDAVVYGLLDSHAMASSLSTIRLDNFVYTQEGIKEAWQHVKPDGQLTVGFSIFAGQFIAERIYRALYLATGIEPIAFFHAYNYGATFVVSRTDREMIKKRISLAAGDADIKFLELGSISARQKVPTDNWPYLYVRPDTFPWLYLLVLGGVLIFSLGAIPIAYGSISLSSDFSPPMFFMGAAFLLLETRGVTALSLLYGSTWIVNAMVFIGILAMAMLATLLVRRGYYWPPKILFLLLVASTLALWQFDLNLLNSLPIAVRGIVGGLIHAIPVFFAGMLFPTLLQSSSHPPAALGSNLLGAVVGGCIEYLSMLIGLSAMVAIAGIFYLLAMYTFETGTRSK